MNLLNCFNWLCPHRFNDISPLRCIAILPFASLLFICRHAHTTNLHYIIFYPINLKLGRRVLLIKYAKLTCPRPHFLILISDSLILYQMFPSLCSVTFSNYWVKLNPCHCSLAFCFGRPVTHWPNIMKRSHHHWYWFDLFQWSVFMEVDQLWEEMLWILHIK